VITLPVWSASMEARHFGARTGRNPGFDPAHIQELIRDWNPLRPICSSSRRRRGRVHCSRNRFARLNRCSVAATRLSAGSRAGPKPTTVTSLAQVHIDRAASNPFTTHEVLAEMHKTHWRHDRCAPCASEVPWSAWGPARLPALSRVAATEHRLSLANLLPRTVHASRRPSGR